MKIPQPLLLFVEEEEYHVAVSCVE